VRTPKYVVFHRTRAQVACEQHQVSTYEYSEKADTTRAEALAEERLSGFSLSLSNSPLERALGRRYSWLILITH
jgi:hypothetical protein